MVDEGRDRAFMERALFHAERGRGRTAPNPIVGAVVVGSDGVVVGQGAHLAAGGPHAEVVALEEAGPRAAGATLYCTLEPCAHHGRTPPCVERIAASGVVRVVAATGDPNPLVRGAGFAYLRAHGIDVTEGVLREAAARQHAPFFTWIGKRRPFVTLKMAISRDGFVGRAGAPVALTGPEANRFFHRQRAEVDAIGVGAGTVVADDPQLTARGAYRWRPLPRVVVDWRGRAPAGARLWSTVSAGPVIILVLGETVARAPARFAALAALGVTIETFDVRDLRAAAFRLANRSVVSLLIEGGPALHAACCEAGLADRVQVVHAPVEVGAGTAAAPWAALLEARGARIARRRELELGPDRLTEFDVHWTD